VARRPRRFTRPPRRQPRPPAGLAAARRRVPRGAGGARHAGVDAAALRRAARPARRHRLGAPRLALPAPPPISNPVIPPKPGLEAFSGMAAPMYTEGPMTPT
jgi:hypothetical protein